jgi:membrane protease YdiL (CAAX protease family)
MKTTENSLLLKFFLITFVISWVVTVTIALQVHGIIAIQVFPFGVSWLMGLVPGAVALCLCVKRKEFIQNALGRSTEMRFQLIIISLTFGFLGVVYLIHILINSPIKLQWNPKFLAVQFAAWFVLALGEELGWRGFALPILLKKRSVFNASLLLGIIWCVWHFPKILGSPYIKDWSMASTGLFMFSLQIIAGNFIICWLFIKSNRNVWATTLYHSLWNLVSTVYLFMAMDKYATALLVVIALVIILLDRESMLKITDDKIK